jgi:nucleoid DNA-binding protein
MDQLIEVTIPRTQTRKKDNLFSSLYTVTITQVYEVKVVLDDSYEYILFKRYKEFRILHKNIKKLPTSQTLPKFPGKVINPMNPLTISKRKSALEKWLQVALSIKKAENFIKIFLNIKTELIDEISQLQKMSKDEYFVKEFCDKINSNLNSKVNIIETFTKNFFTKKRNISEEHLKTLVKTLILICADEYIGSKALDFLHKLLSSDHNREFGNYIKEMIKMPVKDLKKMKLDEYILNKRFCESQIQAFNVLNILYLSYDLESFQLIVKFI